MEIHLFEGQYAQGNRKKGKNVLADHLLPVLFVYLVVITQVSGTYLLWTVKHYFNVVTAW